MVVEDVDLEITKTFADDEVTAGAAGTHTFSLVIDNLGDSDADNVSITDIAPAGLTFISEDSADCTITLAGNLSCSFAHLGAEQPDDDHRHLRRAGHDRHRDDHQHRPRSTSDEDSDTDDDTVVVVEDVDLEITKTFADDEVTAGAAGTYTFSLVIDNLGDSDADNVSISRHRAGRPDLHQRGLGRLRDHPGRQPELLVRPPRRRTARRPSPSPTTCRPRPTPATITNTGHGDLRRGQRHR